MDPIVWLVFFSRSIHLSQGMGIYLFGELLISEDRKQKELAENIFDEVKGEMDGCTYQTVYEMLNGIQHRAYLNSSLQNKGLACLFYFSDQ